MPRKKQTDQPGAGRPTVGKQVNVRLPDDILKDLEYVERGLSMDTSTVIRTILREQLHIYVDKATETLEQIEQSRQRAEKRTEKSKTKE